MFYTLKIIYALSIIHLYIFELTWTVVHCWWCSECSIVYYRRRRAEALRRSASPSPAWRRSADRRRLIEERQIHPRISSSPSSHSTTYLRMRPTLIAKCPPSNDQSVDVFACETQTLLRPSSTNPTDDPVADPRIVDGFRRVSSSVQYQVSSSPWIRVCSFSFNVCSLH